MSDRDVQGGSTAVRRLGATGRRGLMAGIGVLVAGTLAKATARPAAAADGDDLEIGAVNTSAGTTELQRTTGLGSPVFVVSTNLSGVGAIEGRSTTAGGGAAVVGTAVSAAGIFGTSESFVGAKGVSKTSFGVAGESEVEAGVRGTSKLGIGVVGEGPGQTGVMGSGPTGVRGVGGKGDGKDAGTGVRGESDSGTGVFGSVSSGTGVAGQSSTGIGVQGQSATQQGVLGQSQQSSGVEGTSASAAGVRGSSPTGAGVVGTAGKPAIVIVADLKTGVFGQAPDGTGVAGITGSGIGVHGKASANGKAAFFEGAVVINGSLTLNGQPVSAVPGDGSVLTRLASSDDPALWSERFGRSTLVDGQATVRLDAAAAAIVRAGGEYYVFLTPEGDSQGLYVSERGPAEFAVREQQPGTSNLPFSYRVVLRPGGADSRDAEPRLV